MTRRGTEPKALLARLEERTRSSREDQHSETRTVSEIEGYYRRHAGRLIAQIARRAGCSEDAREVVHEAVTRFLSRDALRNPEVRRLDAYMAEASRNLLTDRTRSRLRFTQISDELRSSEPQHVDQIVFLETRDKLRRLEQAMQKLKPRTRAIFLAHRLRGLSYAEIATETGLSVKGVEKQMAKAIAKLSRFLDRS
jgi:RNA polymerase sigma factor (sigma-70 family)